MPPQRPFNPDDPRSQLKATREILKSLDHIPMRKLGQNFLVDGNILEKILAWSEAAPGKVMVEVGAGLGVLSSRILQEGVELYAIEMDNRLANHLILNLQPFFPDSFHLRQGDAMDEPLAMLPEEIQDFSITANLPYAISTPWMAKVLSGQRLPSRMVLMLQKEAADRFTSHAGDSDFGPISILLEGAYSKTSYHRVPATCFEPRPKVDSALVQLDRKSGPRFLSSAGIQFMRAIFTQRRKQIGGLLKKHQHTLPLEQALQVLLEAGFSTTDRPHLFPFKIWYQWDKLIQAHHNKTEPLNKS